MIIKADLKDTIRHRKKPIIEDLEVDDNYEYELRSLHNYNEVIEMSIINDYPLLDSDYDDISNKYYEYKGRRYPRKVFTNVNILEEKVNVGKNERND